jgi:hypothetical protein
MDRHDRTRPDPRRSGYEQSGFKQSELPTVTVFGAGIAGLTAAHELVERGFKVQVVEPEESEFEEYECIVGGLAANQFSRVRAAPSELHPGLSEREFAEVAKFRDGALEQTSKRFPLRERIRFCKREHASTEVAASSPVEDEPKRTKFEPQKTPIPQDWKEYWDEHGTLNRRKLEDVLATIRSAALHYMFTYFPQIAIKVAYGYRPSEAECQNDPDMPIRISQLRKFVARETLLVKIVGYTDTDGTAENNREIARNWATEVRDALIGLNNAAPQDLQVWALEDHLIAEVRGSANPRYDQSTPTGRDRSNRVEFEIVEQVIPGEHGFRFFPNFYRHLFDTMKRTPILDDHRFPTSATTFDQLVRTPISQLALEDGNGPQIIEMRRFFSIHQIDDTLKLVYNKLNFTPRDLLGLQYHMARYLTSGPSRRRTEAEPTNFIKYIGGDDKQKRYSQAALDFINRAPRALAAMSATESDARTQFDVSAQMMAIHPTQDFVADMTLNGPTSGVWLDHWKRYLRIQGVNFFVGRIKSLQIVSDRYLPVVEGPDSWLQPRPEDAQKPYVGPRADGTDVDDHRFVLALPFQAASDLIWAASTQAQGRRFTGAFAQLVKFDQITERRSRAEGGSPTIEPARDPNTGKPAAPYPLRTISGLQYFFGQEYRFGEGNVYYVSAPWGLTSISQFSYWRERVRPVGAFLGQISVDVGDWHAFYPPAQSGPKADCHGHTAWNSSCHEIAEKTWAQIKAGLETEYAGCIRAPRYFHIDRNIVFSQGHSSGFRGSARFRVTPGPAQHDFSDPKLAEFKFNIDARWSAYALPRMAEPVYLTYSPEFDGQPLSAGALVETINRNYGEQVFAIADPEYDTDLLISPKAYANRFIIAFRSDSRLPSYLAVKDAAEHFIAPDPEDRLRVLQGVVANLASRTQMPLQIVEMGSAEWGPQSFALTSADGEKFDATVFNAEGAVELLDGPELDVHTSAYNLHLINSPHPGSGWVMSGAVRANAILGVPRDRVQPGRRYGFNLRVGAEASRPVIHEAERGHTPAKVCDELLRQLRRRRSAPVMAERHGETQIILSPIAKVESTTIAILDPSEDAFRVRINDIAIEVSGAGKTVIAVRDELLRGLQERAGEMVAVSPLGNSSLHVAARQVDAFRIGVLNSDRKIELIGAPALTIEAKDLELVPPSEGFVVLDNRQEFLINIPDQWRSRPGLHRVEPGAPDAYGRLAGAGGMQAPEIYYWHDCRLLEYWVAAGTYMATYTRMTTMEAANESGRHAAAAILFMRMYRLDPADNGTLIRLEDPILAGDLPRIWNVEDHEPDDLKYYTALDEALFKDGLPHVLDILSVTQLVNTLLEADLPEDQINAYVRETKKILDGVMVPLHKGMLAAGGVFSQLVDAHRNFTQGMLGAITGADRSSETARDMLTRYLAQVRTVADYYRALWSKPV